MAGGTAGGTAGGSVAGNVAGAHDPYPVGMTQTYRCAACGNKTRFDVFETIRRRQYHHYTLGGELSVDEEEMLERTVERVVCRWCGRADAIEAGGEPSDA